ncbi:MAG TPA: HNH endonuclease [Pirellulaceae bacterium]|nr:HNH endonuclease [Pirellulaceae bacterium]
MDTAKRKLVRERANECCEYCGRHQDESPLAPLQIEHIIPRKHGGSDDQVNLCLACIDCNLAKSSNLTGIDPDTGDANHPVQLFNPRTQNWVDHFERQGPVIVGKTDVGRTTVFVLNMNGEDQVERRRQSVR